MKNKMIPQFFADTKKSRNNKKFRNEIIKKLGVKQSLQKTRKKSDMYECNNAALFLSNKDLAKYFIKYYTAINAGKSEEEVLNCIINKR